MAMRKYKAELNELFAQNTLEARQYNSTIDLPPIEVLISQDPVQLKHFLENKFEQICQKNQGLALQTLFKTVEQSKQ